MALDPGLETEFEDMNTQAEQAVLGEQPLGKMQVSVKCYGVLKELQAISCCR